jgi:hypothetical protein
MEDRAFASSLEPRRLVVLAPGGQAADDFGFMGMSLITGRHGFDGGTRIHTSKGNIGVFTLAVTANEARSKLAVAVAIGRKLKVRGKMFLQKSRAVQFRSIFAGESRSSRSNHVHVIIDIVWKRKRKESVIERMTMVSEHHDCMASPIVSLCHRTNLPKSSLL